MRDRSPVLLKSWFNHKALALVVLPVLLAATFVFGLCMAVINLIWTNTVQAIVPPEALGAALLEGAK